MDLPEVEMLFLLDQEGDLGRLLREDRRVGEMYS